MRFVQSAKNKEKENNTLPFVSFLITETEQEKKNFISNRKTLTLDQKIGLIQNNQMVYLDSKVIKINVQSQIFQLFIFILFEIE